MAFLKGIEKHDKTAVYACSKRCAGIRTVNVKIKHI